MFRREGIEEKFVSGELLIDVEDKLNRKKYVSSLDIEIVRGDDHLRVIHPEIRRFSWRRS